MNTQDALIRELSELLGSGAVLTAHSDIQHYVEDWRGRFRGVSRCVVLPSTTEQVAQIVRACNRERVSIVPQGGNTSLCEGAVPRALGPPSIVLSLNRMRRIRSLDLQTRSIEVEAGCVLSSIQRAATDKGLLYPVSLGAEGSCQIGGNIATNAGGTGVLRYGCTRDNVLGLEVVLPDGRVWSGLQALRKNNTGIDLKHIFIGSEGTLGMITAATLKLHPLPRARSVAWFSVETPDAALLMLGQFQRRAGSILSAFEMMNSTQLEIVLRHIPGRRAPVASSDAWHVLVELADTSDDETAVAKVMEEVLDIGLVDGIRDAVVATSGSQQAAFWDIRHSIAEGNKRAGIGIGTDCAVPISRVPEFIRRATEVANSVVPSARISVASHLGDGNVHLIPIVSFEEWRAHATPSELSYRVKHAVNEVAYSLGGTFSAEHGIGQTLTREMELFKPVIEIELMRRVKAMLDPLGLFNPDRLLPPQAESVHE